LIASWCPPGPYGLVGVAVRHVRGLGFAGVAGLRDRIGLGLIGGFGLRLDGVLDAGGLELFGRCSHRLFGDIGCVHCLDGLVGRALGHVSTAFEHGVEDGVEDEDVEAHGR
jgi:hypothetical protein